MLNPIGLCNAISDWFDAMKRVSGFLEAVVQLIAPRLSLFYTLTLERESDHKMASCFARKCASCAAS